MKIKHSLRRFFINYLRDEGEGDRELLIRFTGTFAAGCGICLSFISIAVFVWVGRSLGVSENPSMGPVWLLFSLIIGFLLGWLFVIRCISTILANFDGQLQQHQAQQMMETSLDRREKLQSSIPSHIQHAPPDLPKM